VWRRGCSEVVSEVVGTIFVVFVVTPSPSQSTEMPDGAPMTPVANNTRLTPLQSCRCRSTRAPRRNNANPRAHSELALQFSLDTAYQDVNPLLWEDLSDFQNANIGDML